MKRKYQKPKMKKSQTSLCEYRFQPHSSPETFVILFHPLPNTNLQFGFQKTYSEKQFNSVKSILDQQP